jgi:hypothetical protein
MTKVPIFAEGFFPDGCTQFRQSVRSLLKTMTDGRTAEQGGGRMQAGDGGDIDDRFNPVNFLPMCRGYELAAVLLYRRPRTRLTFLNGNREPERVRIYWAASEVQRELTFHRAQRADIANGTDVFSPHFAFRRRWILSSVAGCLPFVDRSLLKARTKTLTGLKTSRVSFNWRRLPLHSTMSLPVSSQTNTPVLNRPNPNRC